VNGDQWNLSKTKKRMMVEIMVMKVLELRLPQPTASKLREAAERLSVSPEQLSILSIEEKLAQLEDEFRCSAEYALKKNADLYRRLA
jgi:antitoxin FitA